MLARRRGREETGVGHLRFAKRNIPLHLLNPKLSFDLFFRTALITHMDAHDVLRDRLISRSVVVVTHDEDHIESRQDRSLEVNVLTWGLQIVVAPEDGISCGEY